MGLLTKNEVMQRADIAIAAGDFIALEHLIDAVNAQIVSGPPEWVYKENMVDLAEYLTILLGTQGDDSEARKARKLAVEYRRGLL